MLNQLSGTITSGNLNPHAAGLHRPRGARLNHEGHRRPGPVRSEPVVQVQSRGVLLSLGCWDLGLAVRDRPRPEALLSIAPARQAPMRHAGPTLDPTPPFTCRVELSEPIISAMFEIAPAAGSDDEVELDEKLSADPEIRRLAWEVLSARVAGHGVQELQQQALCLAIATRLPGYGGRRDGAAVSLPTSGLPKWRLKRVREYVEANLASRIRLADLASTAGLTKMYFAAQFRAAQGVSPHEYVLRRRIARAQDLLAGTDESLVQVALSVGFQTQAHFTTVFKRFVGSPPNGWRVAVRRAGWAEQDLAA